jgi:hypothetical protein
LLKHCAPLERHGRRRFTGRRGRHRFGGWSDRARCFVLLGGCCHAPSAASDTGSTSLFVEDIQVLALDRHLLLVHFSAVVVDSGVITLLQGRHPGGNGGNDLARVRYDGSLRNHWVAQRGLEGQWRSRHERQLDLRPVLAG